MNPMSESKFNMWRACVAIVHLDNVVTVEERAWSEDKINKLPLSSEQKVILTADLEKAANFEESFQKVTDKCDLAFILNTLRVIGHLDKDFSEVEKENFKKLEDIVLKGLDLGAIEAEVERVENYSYHEDEVFKNKNKHSIFGVVINALLKTYNSGDYVYPKKEK